MGEYMEDIWGYMWVEKGELWVDIGGVGEERR